MTKIPPIIRALTLACVAVWLTGCAGARLYSEARDKQGQDLKKTWEAVDLKAIITTERGNLADLLQTELDTQDKLAEAVRDQTLQAMLGNTVGQLKSDIDQRLKNIAGVAAGQSLAKVQIHERQYSIAHEKLQLDRKIFDRYGLEAPGCDKPFSTNAQESYKDPGRPAVQDADITAALRDMKLSCDELKSIGAKSFSANSDLGQAYTRLDLDMDALTAAEEKSKKASDSYTAALKIYDAAVKENVPPESRLATIKASAGAALEILKKAKDAYSTSFLSEEKVASLESALQAISTAKDGKLPPPESGRAAMALVLFPSVIDQTNNDLAEAQKPLAAPLLLQKTLEQLKLEASKRDVAAQEKIVEVDQKICDVLYLQARQLASASAGIKDLAGPLLATPLIDAIDNKDKVDQRERLYIAASKYLDTLNRLDARRYKLEYARIGAQHERMLAYAEINIEQWRALIGTTASQLADFGATGIKAEQINAMINTIGVFWIGSGVNK